MPVEITPTASRLSTSIDRIVRRIVQDYRINRVLMSPTGHHPAPLLPGIVVRPFVAGDRAAIAHDTDGDFGKILGYADKGATGHVLEFSGEIAAVAHYVDRPLYTDTAIWPLRRHEMALVHVATRPAFRRLGFASTLIANATPADPGAPRRCRDLPCRVEPPGVAARVPSCGVANGRVVHRTDAVGRANDAIPPSPRAWPSWPAVRPAPTAWSGGSARWSPAFPGHRRAERG